MAELRLVNDKYDNDKIKREGKVGVFLEERGALAQFFRDLACVHPLQVNALPPSVPMLRLMLLQSTLHEQTERSQIFRYGHCELNE